MADAAALTGFSTALVGAAQGFERGRELAAKDEERKQQRELFRQQKKANDTKYAEMYSPNAVKTREQELEIQLKEQKEKLEQFDKQATMQTLDKTMLHHDQSGNWNSFNEALKSPQGERINRMIGGGGQIKNVTGADITSKEDHTAIVEAVRKLSPEELEKASPGKVDTNKDGTISETEKQAVASMSNEELLSGIDGNAFKKRFGRFVIDMPDGSTRVEFKDITSLWARTGYGEYKSEKDRAAQIKSVELRKKEADVAKTERETELLGTAKPDSKEARRAVYLALKNKKGTLTTEETNTLNSYKKEFEEAEGGSGLTADQKNARAVADAEKRVGTPNEQPGDKQLIESWNRKLYANRTADAKQIERDKIYTQSSVLDKLGYDGTAPPTTEAGKKALSDLRIQRPLTGEPRKLASKIGSLVELGATGSGLNEEQTGIASNLLNDVETYYNENPNKGEDARSSYAQYQATLKHLMYGSALTATEIKSFNQAYGTMDLKLGAVLSKFKTSLKALRNDMIQAGKDPEVNRHVWNSTVGDNARKLDETIHNIEVRQHQLMMAKNKRSEADIEKYAEEHPFKPKLSPAEQKKQDDKKTLGTIFGK